jgi:glycerol kinase
LNNIANDRALWSEEVLEFFDISKGIMPQFMDARDSTMRISNKILNENSATTVVI